MSAGGIEGLELDRTKAIREMHRDYRYEQDDDHRYRRERNKRPEEDEESSDDFNNDCCPAKQVGCRNADGVQHINEILRATGELSIAVLHEAKPDNEPKRNSVPCHAAGFKVQSQIVWRKTPFVIGRKDYHWQHEICWYAFKGPNHPWYGGRDKGTVWDIPKAQKMDGGHPTQKPVECMKRPIENNSSPGQAVYDPFVGSGTTIIAAEMTGRACHAIEIHPPYCDVSVLRWQNFTGMEATLEATGETFVEATAGRLAKSAGSATSGTKTVRASKQKAGASLPI